MEQISEFIAICEWDPARFLVISENVFSALIYYSHLLPLVVTFVFGFYVFTHDTKSHSTRTLFFVTIAISLWLFFDLILWATEKPQYTMFFWSLVNMIEPVIYAGVLYLLYLLLDHRHPSFWKKYFMFILVLPTMLLAPTSFNLVGYDLTNCYREAIEGPIVYYSYFAEIVFILWMLVFGLNKLRERKSKEERKKIVITTFGAVSLLFFFALGNVVGSLFVDWTIGQYGLFGIPMFIGLLAYLITRFKILHVKLISTQLLVASLWFLTFAILFLHTIGTVRVVVFITLILFTLLGYWLVQSVKREVEAREHIERLARDLQVTNTKLAEANTRLEELNKQKSEFVSFATHQLRSPLTAMGGYTSMILEGDYGNIPDKAKDVIKTIGVSTKTLATVVDSYLNLSRIELGTMKYEMTKVDLKDMLEEVVKEQRPNIESKGLELKSVVPTDSFMMSADLDKFKQVMMNTVDNSIKYTPKGSLTVSLSKTGGKIRFMVEDTGIGIAPEVMPKLFQKYSRAPKAGEANIHGTGLGLYIASEIVKAHGGKMWAESDGEGKGSRFIIEVPESK